MASGKPGFRTFARKRKETAEDKFDALFGPKSVSTQKTGEVISTSTTGIATSKRRRQMTSGIRLPKNVNSSEVIDDNHMDTAVEKFDAVFGLSKSTNGNKWNSTEDFSKERAIIKSDGEHSKYDRLFAENEKVASDKFDAIFAESEHKSKTKYKSLTSKKLLEVRSRQSAVLDDLFKFNSWVDTPKSDSSPNTSTTSTPVKPTSPTKLPSITHASMLKVGGRLVLNIQRGGNANSLIEKGGTVLVSPEVKSNPSGELKPDDQINRLPDSSAVSLTAEENSIRLLLSENRREKSKQMEKKLQSLPTPEKLNEKRFQMSKNGRPSSPSAMNFSRKTRRILGAGGKVSKSNVSYNPRHWAATKRDPEHDDSDEAFSLSQPEPSSASSSQPPTDVSKTDLDIPALRKAVTWPKSIGGNTVTSLKCRKSHEPYFTVVHHVKNYQNCLEEGEIKEFEDEVLYLQGGLGIDQPTSVRCLSATSLACKCHQQNFRLYLRAHNVLSDVFSSLQDADTNEALSLATATLLYMLSRDRQIDISKSMLQILLRLVDPLEKGKKDKKPDNEIVHEPEAKYTKIFKGKKDLKVDQEHEYNSVLSKVKDLIDQCGDPLVTSADLSTKMLASEALLRFTARRTSEWYREEIRLKGGLDHIIGLVKTQVDIVDSYPQELTFKQPLAVERSLCMLERLLRVLENGIVNSARNAMYLVTHQRALLLKKLSILITKCKNWLHQTAVDQLSDTPTSSVKNAASMLMKNVISQIIKLLVNISNDSEWSSTRIGDQEGMLYAILCCILLIPDHINEDHRYEIVLLSLGLLVNLVESSPKNRMSLMKMTIPSEHESGDGQNVQAVDALVELFIEREAAARQNEILGEEGVKRAAEAKKSKLTGSDNTAPRPTQHNLTLGDADAEGYWVENDEGMEWVSMENKQDDLTGDAVENSQGSRASVSDPRNVEARLTAEQRNEMKEALEKANDHMEASIVASHAAIVLGCLIHGSRSNSVAIRSQLPNDGELLPMINMLKKFHCFMKLTHGMSKKGEMKLLQIIEDMEEVNLKKTI